MSRRIISALIVFLLLASVAIPAASATEYTPTITCTKEGKNAIGQTAGELTLKCYFGYDHQNPPEGYITEHTARGSLLNTISEEHEVVKYYNTNETTCRMTVKSSLELGVASVLHQQKILEVTCDKHGNTRKDIQ